MTAATLTREAPNHDNLTCYTNYRCRLPECVARYNASQKDRAHAQKNGTWNNLIDATPARQHILRLHAAGFTSTSIARAAGLPPRCIFDFVNSRPTQGLGRRQRTSPENARKILAVTPEQINAGIVDATSTIRRAQALIALGWPKQTIAQRAGLGNAYLTQLFGRTEIHARAADAITTAYDKLRHQRPESHGVSKHNAQKARDLAAANGWPRPAYWDEYPDLLDDPDFTPQATRAAQVADDARWLFRAGLDRDQAAERLGVSRFYIDRALRENPAREETAA